MLIGRDLDSKTGSAAKLKPINIYASKGYQTFD